MTRIVGLDLSLSASGIALPDGTTTTLYPNTVLPEIRLNRLYGRLQRTLEPATPHLAIIEGYAIHAIGPLGQIRRAEWIGCAKLCLRRMRVPWVEVNPTSLKMWATGNGNASKERMVLAARDAGGDPANDDEADAYLLWALARLTVDDLDLFSDPTDRPRRLKLADDLAWPDLEEMAHVG